MRLAIELKLANPTTCQAHVGILEDTMVFPVIVAFTKDKTSKWHFESIGIDIGKGNPHPDVLLEIAAQVFKELAKHDPLTLTPRELLFRSGKSLSRQVCFDPIQKKHVMTRTLEGREAVWWAVTGKGKHLHADASVDNADGEKQAKIFLKAQVAELMEAHPNEIKNLGEWFAGGCKVEREDAGASDYVKLDDIEPLPITATKAEKA
jgi:hypothetical protein